MASFCGNNLRIPVIHNHLFYTTQTMKVPVLEELVEDIESDALKLALTRYEILSYLREHLLDKPKHSYVKANHIYDYVRYVVSLRGGDLSHTKLFSDILNIYSQLAYTITDVPARGNKDPFSSLSLRGVVETIEYMMRKCGEND